MITGSCPGPQNGRRNITGRQRKEREDGQQGTIGKRMEELFQEIEAKDPEMKKAGILLKRIDFSFYW